ncbi:hypothetical protein GGS20DRAFT_557926 [Poronia punctata]|nr:hypothetical protein GGS20DRAFT_557926 [Poronia punctata]
MSLARHSLRLTLLKNPQTILLKAKPLKTSRQINTLSTPAEWIKSTPQLLGPKSHHPFVSNPQPADWGRIVRSRAMNLAIFFPSMTMILGWPYALSSVLDGHVE